MSRLKRVFVIVVGLTALLGANRSTAKPVPVDGAFTLKRGTNLSHWLSQDFGWAPREQFITRNDLRYLARLGFDHVRLPVDEKELWHDDGSANEPAFALLEQALDDARDEGLRVLLDLHTVRAHHFNAANEGGHNTLFSDPVAQERFLDLWRELSARFGHRPVSQLAYEIMNEPVAEDPEDWNDLITRSHAVLRQLEPERVIVLGANMWQQPSMMPLLKVPANDPHIILSVHCYSPMLLTHYGASWTPLKAYTGPIAYPGPLVDAAAFAELQASSNPATVAMTGDARQDWGPKQIRAVFEPAIKRAKELGLPLYCGEWGCMPTVPRADRLAYYRDFVTVLEDAGIGWANWEYKGDFGLFEWHGPETLGGAPDVELIDALLRRP